MPESLPPIVAPDPAAHEVELAKAAEAKVLEKAKLIKIYDKDEKGPFPAGQLCPDLSVKKLADGVFQVSLEPLRIWCFLDAEGKEILDLSVLRQNPFFPQAMSNVYKEQPGPDGEHTLYAIDPSKRDSLVHLPKGSLAYFKAFSHVETMTCRMWITTLRMANGKRKVEQADLDYMISAKSLTTYELFDLRKKDIVTQAMYDATLPKIDMLAMAASGVYSFEETEVRSEFEAERINRATAEAIMKIIGEGLGKARRFELLKSDLKKDTARRIQEEVKAQIDAQGR